MNEKRSLGQASLVLEKITALCDEFLAECKREASPSIEGYLERVRLSAQEMLFRNLLSIEMEFRRRDKEIPNSDEYIRRFPQFKKLIRQSFFESISQASPLNSDDVEPATVSVSRLGDYQLVRELGRGGFGFVYEAKHVRGGDRVALKTLPLYEDSAPHDGIDLSGERNRDLGDRLHRFKREFRSLADINHPNLVGLHKLEADGNQWFFTMDLVDGVDFLSYVRPDGKFDQSRLRSAVSQLVTGVMALHGDNVIHRDLKPSNVMVSHQGQVVILDFGLVAEFGRHDDEMSRIGFVGTPAYASPEQACGDCSSASDWYSVGVMLYESLTGDRPFRETGFGVLQAKQREDPPPIPNATDFPGDLVDLCMRLLARDPLQRPDALDIANVISADTSSTQTLASSAGDHLVGREPHLAVLNKALLSFVEDGNAHSVFISGKSGEGKTSLVEHFLRPIRQDKRFTVLSGRCYDRESVPFKAIDGVIDALSIHLQLLPDAEAALLLPDDITFLTHLFPVLLRSKVIAKAPRVRVASMDRQQVRQRAFTALRLLLKRIADRTPIILFTDDLQWGDTDSAEAMLNVLRAPNSPAVMFIGTYRSDEADDSQFLQSWQEIIKKKAIAIASDDVPLSPLTVDQLHRIGDRPFRTGYRGHPASCIGNGGEDRWQPVSAH